MRFAYPCNLEPEEEPGFQDAYNVSFPDVPGALTCGGDLGEALENAEEVLELALGDYIENNAELPAPSQLVGNQELVFVRPPFAAKLALHQALLQQRITRADLAERLGLTESSVQEMLDPYVETPISQLARSLQVVGRRLLVEDNEADGGTHIFYPAAKSGTMGMALTEFIRRTRRYSLAHDLSWRIEGPDLDTEDSPSRLIVGNHAAILPEDDFLEAKIVDSILKELSINADEF